MDGVGTWAGLRSKMARLMVEDTKTDAKYALHLGGFIYEYSADCYASTAGANTWVFIAHVKPLMLPRVQAQFVTRLAWSAEAGKSVPLYQPWCSQNRRPQRPF